MGHRHTVPHSSHNKASHPPPQQASSSPSPARHSGPKMGLGTGYSPHGPKSGQQPPKGNRERMPSWLPAPRTADEATDVPAEGDPPPRLPLPLPIRKGRGSHGNAGSTPRYLPTAGDRAQISSRRKGRRAEGHSGQPAVRGRVTASG